MPNLTVPAPLGSGPCTGAIQAAIDAVHRDGGGRVTLAAGVRYRSGTINLRSRIELHLEMGAELIASSDPADYAPVAAVGEYGGSHGGFLIQAQGERDVAITGLGTIDGAGSSFMDGWWTEDGPWIRKPKAWRPRGIGLLTCQRVQITGIVIRDAAQWTIHLTGCNDVLIQGITIANGLDVPNCDGIDPDHCRNVRIVGCHIEAGDDGIVLKNTRKFRDLGPCEDVLVSDCTIVSTSAAIKLGTESQGDFRNVLVQNCSIRRSHRGLAIQLRDDGCIENVCFQHCLIETRHFHTKWWGSAEPIYVTAQPRHDGDRPGRIRHVRFRDCLCRGESGAFLSATAASPIEDLMLDSVRLEILHASRWPGGRVDRRPMHSQEHGGLEQGTVHGVTAEHIRGLRLREVEVAWTGEPRPWWGHALHATACPGLAADGLRGVAGRPGLPAAVTG